MSKQMCLYNNLRTNVAAEDTKFVKSNETACRGKRSGRTVSNLCFLPVRERYLSIIERKRMTLLLCRNDRDIVCCRSE